MSQTGKTLRKKLVEDTIEREIVLTRVLDAPRERVWEAWTDSERVAKWWGPYGFTTTTQEREFKVGGTWKHTMIGPDGVEYPNFTQFEEIVEPERIVYTNGGAKKGEYDVHFRTTVTFKEVGSKTELTMRTVFDTVAMRDLVVKRFGAEKGGRQTLSRLASHLAGEFVISRLVDAPRERVWKAWSEPEQLQAWFGPKGFETFHARLDFRPGGTYHYGMRNAAGGVEMWGKWSFREITAPGRLSFVMAFSDKDGGLGRHPLAPSWPRQMLATILFAEMGGKTLVTIKSAPYEATEAEVKIFREGFSSMNQGWSGTFERLDAYLKEEK